MTTIKDISNWNDVGKCLTLNHIPAPSFIEVVRNPKKSEEKIWQNVANYIASVKYFTEQDEHL